MKGVSITLIGFDLRKGWPPKVFYQVGKREICDRLPIAKNADIMVAIQKIRDYMSIIYQIEQNSAL